MKRGWAFAALLGAVAGPVVAQTQSATPPVATATSPTPGSATAPTTDSGSLIVFGNDERRMTVPVSIAKNGPFHFIVDTGAERTVISRQLADQLTLSPGRAVRVTAMANITNVPTALIPSLSVSRIASPPIEAPMMETANLGAAGMIGIDALKGHVVLIDFDRNEMTLKPSSRRVQHYDPGDIVVRAKNMYGQLIVTDARYHGKRISVVVDTGSQVTIGNSALRNILKTPPQDAQQVALLSATGASLQAERGLVDWIEIGGIRFDHVPLAFADAKPFERFGLSKTPAIMLGMDTLRLFRRVRIDFANREVMFTMPRGSVPDSAPRGI
ncbi:MAG: retroviral-like aspartic protease family protein [Sphingomonas sp.]|uniref:aspartyl protease family protein n=1 Tax=Sphingomonas sp. TaxID=28214 RepID=UPI001AD025E0|nr:aspartyl protease family protein [Sphingomonas sp.]MBN8809213.1 retroviral-like aspartic protease family protein [Sphingomonas sp.]